MRFSIFHNFDAIGRWHEYQKVLQEVVEIAQFAEQAGFWSVWYAEQHFRLEGNEATPNPVLQSAWTAAHTSRIRIGQAANIITQWHPIRLAEDLAVLDHMSGGRLEVGIGLNRKNKGPVGSIGEVSRGELDAGGRGSAGVGAVGGCEAPTRGALGAYETDAASSRARLRCVSELRSARLRVENYRRKFMSRRGSLRTHRRSEAEQG